jgi:hypothetical protein
LDGFDVAHLSLRVLSRNPTTGQQTVLWRLAPGYRQSAAGAHAVWCQMFVLDGGVQWGGEEMGRGVFVHRPAGTVELAMASHQGALIYAKVDGWLDFTPA